MPESLETKLYRWRFYLYPCYLGTGGKVTYIAGDWREMRVELPLSWRTINIMGVIFGGAMFSSTDPMYMIMLMKSLGPDYIVWNKAASIEFKKQGKTTLYARFVLTDEDLQQIRADLARQPKIERTFRVELTDKSGTLNAAVEHLIHIRRKEPG